MSSPLSVAVSGSAGSTLKVLKLDRNYIGDKGCAPLVRGLAACKSISVLHLTYNNLGPASARAIAGLMKEKPHAQPTHSNDPLPTPAQRASSSASVEARVDAEVVVEEEWAPFPGGGGGIGGRDWAVCHITELYLGDNPLGSEGVSHVADGLSHSGHLRVLSMPHVGLGDDEEAVKALVAGMEKNTTLTHLDLNYNLTAGRDTLKFKQKKHHASVPSTRRVDIGGSFSMV